MVIKVGDFFRYKGRILRCNRIVSDHVITCTDGFNIVKSDVEEIIYTKLYLQIKNKNFIYVEPEDVNMHQLYFDAFLQNIKFTKDPSLRLSCGNYISIGSHVLYKGELHTVESFRGSEILIKDASGDSTKIINVTRKDFSIPESSLKYYTTPRGHIYIEHNNLLYYKNSIKVATEKNLLLLEEIDGHKIRLRNKKYYVAKEYSRNHFICNGVLKDINKVNFYLEDCFAVNLEYIFLLVGDYIKWVGPEDHKGAFRGEARVVEIRDKGVTITMRNSAKKDLWKYLKHIELVRRTNYMDKHYDSVSSTDKQMLLVNNLISPESMEILDKNGAETLHGFQKPEPIKQEPIKQSFYTEKEVDIKIKNHLFDRTTYAGANNLSGLIYFYKTRSKEEIMKRTIIYLKEKQFFMFKRGLDMDTDKIASPIEKRFHIITKDDILVSDESVITKTIIFDGWEM